MEAGIQPIAAIGDFDSVSDEQYGRIERDVRTVHSFEAEKNETDLELAIQYAASLEPEEIVMTGVTCGRLDHSLSALHLLYTVQQKWPNISFTIENERNALSIYRGGTHRLGKEERFHYLSLFAMEGTVRPLTLRGVKYEVTNEQLTLGTTRFTSNEWVSNEAIITFQEGVLVVVRTANDTIQA